VKNVYLFVLSLVGLTLGIRTLYTQKTPPKIPAIIVTSEAFELSKDPDSSKIPEEYTCEGRNVPPPLAWRQVPPGTRSFVLLVEDPDAPGGHPWVHWLVYDMPYYRMALLEKEYVLLSKGGGDGKAGAQLRAEQLGKEGRNSWKKEGYGGPCPQQGMHHYHFTIFALDVETLGLVAGATKEQVLNAMKGHVLTSGTLVGTYERRIP
jgi:Raf kinase inhibitor-like YbhB/YbcL family protein